jgi:hypothetical protein
MASNNEQEKISLVSLQRAFCGLQEVGVNLCCLQRLQIVHKCEVIMKKGGRDDGRKGDA